MAANSVAASVSVGPAASHIVLETSREEEPLARRPETVVERFELKSVFRGTRTRLTLYKEGFLAVHTEFGGLRRKDLTLDLRYLDARPSLSRVGDVRLLYSAGAAAALAIVLVALAALGVGMPIAFLTPAFALVIAASIVAWRYFYATGEQAVFRTARGHGEVLGLFGGIGDITTLRRIVPAIVTSIRAAAEPSVSTQTYLREEMREHYRLAQTGVISEDECSTCTQRILSQFAIDQEPRN